MKMRSEHIIKAVAEAAAFNGWYGDVAVHEVVDKLGLPAIEIKRSIGYLPIDRLSTYVSLLNDRMLASTDAVDFQAFRISEKIEHLIFQRIKACEQEDNGKESIGRAVTFLMSPMYLKQSMLLNLQTADAIWRCVGDTSTDLNYYSKRILAGGVYASALLYYLRDDSEGSFKTKEFINRRIQNVLGIEKTKSAIKRYASGKIGGSES